MYPNVKNSFEFGLGYTNDIGFRSKIVWKKPWINSYGHSLETNFSLSIPEQFIDLSYKIPLYNHPLEQYYLIQGGLVYENIYKLQSRITTLNLARYWNYSNYWQWVINLHWYINHCIQNYNLNKTIMLISPGISLNRIQKKGVVFPYWGNSHRYSMNMSTKFWGSDINFFVLHSQDVWIKQVYKNHRFVMRNDISWMHTSGILPYTIPLFRSFFIKDRIVRGHKCKFFSTNDDLNFKKLIINTVEYQYNLFDKWWSAIFLDIGEITKKIRSNNLKGGIGFGIRWQLPIGPLQLDVAVPLKYKIKINRKLFCFYINLGPEL